jgi:hypothetical protein
VDKDQLPPLHDQTTVTAKLHCGRTRNESALLAPHVTH